MTKNNKVIKNMTSEYENNLMEFAKKNLADTENSSSASTINVFAEKMFIWLKAKNSKIAIDPENIIKQVHELASYEGQTKTTMGVILTERNSTFENNVRNAFLIAHVWYAFETENDLRNTVDSEYLYFKNNTLCVAIEYCKNVNSKFKGSHMRQALSEIQSVYNEIFGIANESKTVKGLAKKLEALNEEYFNKMFNAFITKPSAKQQAEGKQPEFNYTKFMEVSQSEVSEIKSLNKFLVNQTIFFNEVLNFVDTGENVNADTGNVEVSPKIKSSHFNMLTRFDTMIEKSKSGLLQDSGLSEFPEVVNS